MRSEKAVGCLVALLLATGAGAEPLVGPSVGNGDALLAEGNRQYNARRYAEAADSFLKATRAAPEALAAYLGLARARLATRKVPEAYTAYRTYLRAAPESLERNKAQRELELCERQLRGAKEAVLEKTARHVDRKADFYEALQRQRLEGEGSAAALLRELVAEGYLGTDLGDMASRLNAAARETAVALGRRALAGEPLEPARLREAGALYELVRDTGEALPGHEAQQAFFEGLALLREGQAARAQERLGAAATLDAGRPEYRQWQAAARLRGGDVAGALKVMETDFPEDSRTAVLKLEVAMGESGEAGARALEALLFQRYAGAGR